MTLQRRYMIVTLLGTAAGFFLTTTDRRPFSKRASISDKSASSGRATFRARQARRSFRRNRSSGRSTSTASFPSSGAAGAATESLSSPAVAVEAEAGELGVDLVRGRGLD